MTRTLCLLTLSLTATTAAAKPLVPLDFADGVDLIPNSQDAVQTTLVPLDVYRGVTRADLGDLRVFNAAEEEVPHALRSLAIRAASKPPTLPLKLFPIRGAPSSVLDELTLHFERSAAGDILDLRSRDGGTKDEITQAYLMDTGGEEAPLRVLTLGWAPTSKGFVAQVRVEASDDLANWQVVARNVSVARLDYGGHSLERRTIPLANVRSRYLRLTWGAGEASPFDLVEAVAELSSGTPEPERRDLTVEGAAVPTKDNLYQFDLGGPIPMDRATLLPPQKNSLVEASLSSATSAEGPWSRRWSGLLYRVVYEGQEMNSEAIALDPNSARYWRLEVDPKGGGLGKGLPRLKAAWLPQQLLFVARGESPFVLAFGSYLAQPSTFNPNTLLELAPGQKVEALAEDSVRLGTIRVLGGEAARTAPVPPPPWQIYILWGLLIAGVLLLGLMAVRLIRQLNAAKPEGGTPGAGGGAG